MLWSEVSTFLAVQTRRRIKPATSAVCCWQLTLGPLTSRLAADLWTLLMKIRDEALWWHREWLVAPVSHTHIIPTHSCHLGYRLTWHLPQAKSKRAVIDRTDKNQNNIVSRFCEKTLRNVMPQSAILLRKYAKIDNMPISACAHQ